MNSIFSRTLKALCSLLVVGVLSACGASSTVDPFNPTRVIGLGDSYNDMTAGQYTVSGLTGTSTVVGQIAALYGASDVISKARSDYEPRDGVKGLAAQVALLGSLSATADLVVITAGTTEFVSGSSASDFLLDLKGALNTLKLKGARHIIVMTVVDIHIAPGTIYGDPFSFNSVISGGLRDYTDVVRYGNVPRPDAFAYWASGASYCLPTANRTDPQIGCADGTGNGSSAALFLADYLHPTPVGNQWIGQQVYNNTGGGWR